ncbi:hypothetical protein [Pseudomonas sp. NPDC008258]|uniref:hypothetical protein n=1 Tax=Pseudomonas sp. NPDC008258 TaxID=3364418 RepID=UPI0036EC3A14
MPTFILTDGRGDEQINYGFPAQPGEGSLHPTAGTDYKALGRYSLLVDIGLS